ncbi:MAG: hypothetical protein OXF84_11280 [Bacteroidetes bacterium]|nr:hypothetical protein [Bacteroidota bacterium]
MSVKKYDIYRVDGKIIKKDFESESPLVAAQHYLGTLCYEVVAVGKGSNNLWDYGWKFPHFTENPHTWHFGIRKIGSARDPRPVGFVRLSSSRKNSAN